MYKMTHVQGYLFIAAITGKDWTQSKSPLIEVWLCTNGIPSYWREKKKRGHSMYWHEKYLRPIRE